MGIYHENTETAPCVGKNSQTAEIIQQLRLETGRGINQHQSGAAPVHAVDQERAKMTVAGILWRTPVPINEPLPIETDENSTELTEIHGNMNRMRPDGGYTYRSETVMDLDLSPYRANENRSQDLSVRLAMRYAAFLGVNFESLTTGNRENLPLLDNDFELVLRHFWEHLDAEQRRKLIQMAAGLADGGQSQRS
jgi:hypothetical protein